MENISLSISDLKKLMNNKSIYHGLITHPIYRELFGDRMASDTLVAPAKSIEHIIDERGGKYFEYKEKINEIINDPDYIFSSKDGKNRIEVVKYIDKRVHIVLQISFSASAPNMIITLWDTHDDLNHMKLTHYVLYCKK